MATGSGDWIRDLPSFVRALVSPQDMWAEDVERPALSDEDAATVSALVDLGLDEDEARRAVADNAVALAVARHERHRDGRYTLDEVAEKSGVPGAVLEDLQMAMGLPIPELYSKDDVAWVKSLAGLLDLVPVESLVSSARGRGAALAALVRSDLSMVRDELVVPMRKEGADDLAVAVALAEAARALGPLSLASLAYGYERMLDHQLSSELTELSAASHTIEVPVAIGFLDVVGYTALSARVDPTGLNAILDAFEDRCSRIVHAHDGVSIVKFLGDAVMLVAARPALLADVMLELATEVEELADAPLRGGMAHGPTIIREGDYYGSSVNLAARLTDMARPWTVLAAPDLAEDLGQDFDVVEAARMKLRGFGTVHPLAVRRLERPDIESEAADPDSDVPEGDVEAVSAG